MISLTRFELTIVFKGGYERSYDMEDADALDSALSQYLDEYPRPMSIALRLKGEWGQKSADVIAEDIIALEYERTDRTDEGD